MSYPIVGAHFRPPAKSILQVLANGTRLVLRHEPSNPYDTEAVQVLVLSGDIPKEAHETLNTLASGYGFTIEDILAEPEIHLGYIPRTITSYAKDDLRKATGNPQATEGFGILTSDAKGSPKVEVWTQQGKPAWDEPSDISIPAPPEALPAK